MYAGMSGYVGYPSGVTAETVQRQEASMQAAYDRYKAGNVGDSFHAAVTKFGWPDTLASYATWYFWRNQSNENRIRGGALDLVAAEIGSRAALAGTTYGRTTAARVMLDQALAKFAPLGVDEAALTAGVQSFVGTLPPRFSTPVGVTASGQPAPMPTQPLKDALGRTATPQPWHDGAIWVWSAATPITAGLSPAGAQKLTTGVTEALQRPTAEVLSDVAAKANVYLPPPGSGETPKVQLPGSQEWVDVTSLPPSVRDQVQQDLATGGAVVGQTENGGMMVTTGQQKTLLVLAAALGLFLLLGGRKKR